MDSEMGVFLVTENNNILGHYNDNRLHALAWYKRLWAKINKNYRNKYIDIEPFKCKCE